jgi:hypothetical protein
MKFDTCERVELITGGGRLRSGPLGVKARTAMESLEGGVVICVFVRGMGRARQHTSQWAQADPKEAIFKEAILMRRAHGHMLAWRELSYA